MARRKLSYARCRLPVRAPRSRAGRPDVPPPVPSPRHLHEAPDFLGRPVEWYMNRRQAFVVAERIFPIYLRGRKWLTLFGEVVFRRRESNRAAHNPRRTIRPMIAGQCHQLLLGGRWCSDSTAHLRRRIPAGPGDADCSIPSLRQRLQAGAKEKRREYGACEKNNGSQVRKIESLFASSLRRWGNSGLIMLLKQRICNYLNILVEIEDWDCPTTTENRLPRMCSSAGLPLQQRRTIPTEYPTRI